MKNWERKKKEEIKERTIKGLEPSLNNIIKKHELEKVNFLDYLYYFHINYSDFLIINYYKKKSKSFKTFFLKSDLSPF